MKKRILLFSAIAGISYLTLSSYVTGTAATEGLSSMGAETDHSSPAGCNSGHGWRHATSATPQINVSIEIDSRRGTHLMADAF